MHAVKGKSDSLAYSATDFFSESLMFLVEAPQHFVGCCVSPNSLVERGTYASVGFSSSSSPCDAIVGKD